MRKTWQLRGEFLTQKTAPVYDVKSPEYARFLEASGGSPVVARLLLNRGIDTPEKAMLFLDLEGYQPTSYSELPDIEPAVARIIQAIDEQEPILIFGDFDVDGISGASVLLEGLRAAGAKVSYYIPDRLTEGHGLNTTALCRLVSSRQLKLVISTDTGITNFTEVSLLKGLGVDTIITDHHELPENLPPSVANINPKRIEDQQHPLAQLCGAGVAYKVCEAVLDAIGAEPEISERLLDLAAIGTVADMVPLVGENRYIVYRGLQILNLRQRPGVRQILENALVPPEKVLNSDTIGFTIGPRLNAMGRLENATDAVELMTTDDPERVRVIAAKLEQLNRQRQELCEKTFLEAEQYFRANGELDGRRAIILGSPDWNPGIIGIVASRLIEKYHVPVFMMVFDEAKDVVRCSARSIPGFHMHEQLLALEEYFLNFGGHAGAAGFSLKPDRLNSFKAALYALTDRTVTDEQMQPKVLVDDVLDWSQMNPHLISLIERLAPFGQENPAPKFVVENVTIGAQRAIGEGGKHLKLILTPEKQGSSKNDVAPLEALLWNYQQYETIQPSERYDFMVHLELNTYNNQTRVQLMVEDYIQTAERRGLKPQKLPTQAIVPKTTAPTPLQNLASDFNQNWNHSLKWIDHRDRQALDAFVGQLLLPLQDNRKLALFCEGRPPEIPFLDPAIVINRQTVKQLNGVQELILWDLPPSPEGLQSVLNECHPEIIHWVAGKYPAVPLSPSPKDMLTLIYRVLKTVGAPDSEFECILPDMATTLASTPEVIRHGLVLLAKMNLLKTRLDRSAGAVRIMVKLPAVQQASTTVDTSELLEFAAFEEALTAVSEYRRWLLKTPLDTIRQQVQLTGVTEAPIRETVPSR